MSPPATPEDDQRALVEVDGPYFAIPPFSGHHAVLAQLSRIGEITRAELAEVLAVAGRACAPKSLVEQHAVSANSTSGSRGE